MYSISKFFSVTRIPSSAFRKFSPPMARTSRSRWTAPGLLLLLLASLFSFSQPAHAQALTQVFNLSDPSGSTVPVQGYEINGVAVNAVTNKVYIACQSIASPSSSGIIVVLNGANNKVLANITDTTTGAGQPYAVAVNPVSNIIYVANANGGSGGSVTVIDGATDTYAGTYTAGSPNGPKAIVVDSLFSDNKVWIANTAGNTVTGYPGAVRNAGGGINLGSGGGAITVGTAPISLAFNPETGLLYVANSGATGTNNVTVINVNTSTVAATINDATSSNPVAVAVDPSSNNAYVVNKTTSTAGETISVTVVNGSSYSTTMYDPSSDGNVQANPTAIAVNPLTQRVYVSEYGTGSGVGAVSVFQGGGLFTTQRTNSGATGVAVDTASDTAIASGLEGDISVFVGMSDGFQGTTLQTGTGLEVPAVNPVTHKAYVSIKNGGNLPAMAVVDEANNATSPLTVETSPWAVAVNPVTNTIYVANYDDDDVSVINGSTNTVGHDISVGNNPDAILVDPVNNLIYVANYSSNSVTVINGVDESSQIDTMNGTTITPDSLAINPVVNTIYGASSGTSLGFQFTSSAGSQNIFPGGYVFGAGKPIAVAANPASGVSYTLLATYDPSQTAGPILAVSESGAGYGTYGDVCYLNQIGQSSLSTPLAMDVNPVTNSVFVACSDGNINVVQGESGFSFGTTVVIPNTAGSPGNYVAPYSAVAVNPVTNMTYVADEGNSYLYVINGATNTFTTAVEVGLNPVAIAVNVATNKIYVLSSGSTPLITVIDGATLTPLGTIPVGSSGQVGSTNTEIAANPATGNIYSVTKGADKAWAVTENPLVTDPITTTASLDPSNANNSGNTTYTSLPTFTFTPTDGLVSSSLISPAAVYFQVDTKVGTWIPASPTSGNNWGGTIPSSAPLTPGFHILYAYATDGDDSNAGALAGETASPLVGAVASYGFLVAPPIADISSTIYFGNEPQGSTSSPTNVIFVNNGGAPMSYSFAIGGPNSSDFAAGAPTYGTTCAMGGGVLPANSSCSLGITFTPSTTSSESAFITFTDNSLGISSPLATQQANFNGTGTAPVTYTVTVTPGGSGSGGVTSSPSGINCQWNASSNPQQSGTCSASFAPGTVTLTASGTFGSTFTGWGGACTGTGTCVINLTNANQSVTATFAAPSSYTLLVTGSGNGTGNVTDSFSAINCTETSGVSSGTCSASYVSGTSVTLTAGATAPNSFVVWGGACASFGTASSCTVTMNSSQTATATFATGPPMPTAYVGLGTGAFGTVTLTTGSYTQSGSTGTLLSGLSVSPQGNLYGGAFEGTTLYQVNPANGALTSVGTSGISYWLTGSTTSGVYALDQSLNLYSVNVATAATTLIGSTGITLPPSSWSGVSTGSSTFYLTTGSIGSPAILYSINTTTGVGTEIGSTGVPNIGAMVFENGTLYAGSGQNAPFNIYTLNIATGAATLVTSTSSGSFWGLAPLGVSVKTLGTGTGTVSDNQGYISCTDTAGAQSGTCVANENPGTPVTLTAAPVAPATFGGWGGPCASFGTATTCTLTVNSGDAVTADFLPPPASVTLTFPVSTAPQTQQGTFDCTITNPTPSNPCTDPDGQGVSLTVQSVSSQFSVVVTATEFPPSQFDGICESNTDNASGVAADFDCRFLKFFSYGIDPITSGTIVPYCYPYANGNCVHYEVNNGTPGGEPDPSSYLGPVNWKITWNDDTITAPAPYWTGSTPQLYDDPDYAVNPTAPYGTNCAAVMMVQSGTTPTYDCQFEFDITTFFNPTEPVDSGIGGNTKQFNDVVVAWPPTNTPSNANIPLLNANSTPNNPSVSYGNGIGFTITLTNNGSTTAGGITLNDPLPGGNGVNWVVNPTGTTVPNCSVNGTNPDQTLSCSPITLGQGVTETILVTSSAAAAGIYSNVATFTIGTQQALAVATTVVNAISSSTALLSTGSPSTYGQPVTFTATVSPLPTVGDTVTFKDGATTLGTGMTNAAGQATYPTSTLTATTHSITAVFAGDGNVATSTSSPFQQTVSPDNTTTTITSNLSTPTIVNQAYSVAYTVTSNLPGTLAIPDTDTVNVSDGSGATCSSTVAVGSCLLTSTTPGAKTITATYVGDSNYNTSTSNGVSHTVGSSSATLTVTEFGTGSGNVSDGGNLNCSEASGVSSGNCSNSYSGSPSVTLTATASNGSTLVSWGGACATVGTINEGGNGGSCTLTVSSNMNVTANFIPPPTTVMVTFPVSTTPVTQTAAYNCPGNPNPITPSNPCTATQGPNASGVQLTAQGVNTSFSVNITATEVPPSQFSGVCTSNTDNASGVAADFDCRFLNFFKYGTDTASGGAIVPYCYPYSNGNCVHYEVTGTNGSEPDPSLYLGPVNWVVTWNNDALVAPGPYWTGSTPQLYDDPDYAPTPQSAVGTNCAVPMTINGVNQTYNCQFEFDITTFYNASQPVDSGIGGNTKQFNDVVVAWPPTTVPGSTTIPLLNANSTPNSPSVTFGTGIGFTITLTNNGATTASGITLNDPLPSGTGVNWVLNSTNPTITGCAISGTNPAQTLTCPAFSLASGATETLKISSSAAAAGIYSNVATFKIGTQQTLAVATTVVNEANTTTTITTSLSTATVTGQAYTVAYTVTSPSGTIPGTDSVTVSDGTGATCVGTITAGSCSLKSTTAGAKTITATFAGDSNYNTSTSTGTAHTVNKANTSTGLTSSQNPSTVGQSVTFTATVAATAPGSGVPASGETVTFKDGSTTLGTGTTNASGAATFTTTSLALGGHSITAVYAGDNNFNTSTSSILSQTVNAAGSTLKISPTSVNFGTVYQGKVGAQFVTLTNSGSSSITISSINVRTPGNAVGDFGEITSCTPYISKMPGTLAAGKSCAIAVGYLASVKIYSPTMSTATLTITDNVTGSPQTVPLSLTMINPQASLSATSLSFGNQKTGTTSAAKTVKITNTGNTPLNLSNLTISGNFAIAASGTTCAKNGTVQASSSCQINVTFTPTSKGSKSGTLTISDNAQNSPQNVSLSGTGN